MNPFPSEDEIQRHLAELNWAAYESDKYVRDAYDQRHGHRWFWDACGRERQETRWFVEHGIRLVFVPPHSYEVSGKEGTQR